MEKVLNKQAEAGDSIIMSALCQMADEDAKRKDLFETLLKYRVSAATEFPPEVCMLEIDGVPFFAKGDIHAVKAKQKQGKTNAIAIFVAAILSGSWGRLRGLRHDAKVLVVDTEQKDADAQTIYNRTLSLAGLPKEDIYDRFQTFAFRALDTEAKLEAVKALIMEFKPDIVFIDGIVDLMGNFNEVDDSKAIIEELIRMSTKEVSGVDPAIVCVLHVNKAADDHNMRGHAGTMLAQKSGNVLEVVKKEGIISVSCSDSRHQDVPTWSFMFDAKGNIVDADAMLEDMRAKASQTKREAAEEKKAETDNGRKNKMLSILNGEGGKMPRAEMRKRLEVELHLCTSTVNLLLKDWIAAGVVDAKGSLLVACAANAANAHHQQVLF